LWGNLGRIEEVESDDLDAAISEARERGVSRAVEILSGREMLSAAEFAKFIGVSREAVRGKHESARFWAFTAPKRPPFHEYVVAKNHPRVFIEATEHIRRPQKRIQTE
jgi:hypothetical protein